MAESRRFEIRLAATEGGNKRSLTIAELGVLLTGINRTINKAVAAGAGADLTYFPLAQEPGNVRSEVVHVENGSIVFTIVSTVSEFVDKNVIQASFLAGIFGNAAWEFTKILSKETTRALRRLGTSVRKEGDYVRVEPTLDNEALPLDAVRRESAEHRFEIPETTTTGNVRPPPDYAKRRTGYTITFYENGERVIEVSFSSKSRTD
jgi:hypothetical protein